MLYEPGMSCQMYFCVNLVHYVMVLLANKWWWERRLRTRLCNCMISLKSWNRPSLLARVSGLSFWWLRASRSAFSLGWFTAYENIDYQALQLHHKDEVKNTDNERLRDNNGKTRHTTWLNDTVGYCMMENWQIVKCQFVTHKIVITITIVA